MRSRVIRHIPGSAPLRDRNINTSLIVDAVRYRTPVTGRVLVLGYPITLTLTGEGVIDGEDCYLAVWNGYESWTPKAGVQIVEEDEWPM